MKPRIKNNQSLLELTHKLAATGFADTSRVGGGNEQLGLDLAKNNQINVLNSINIFKNKLNTLETLIKEQTGSYFLKNLLNQRKSEKNFIIKIFYAFGS